MNRVTIPGKYRVDTKYKIGDTVYLICGGYIRRTKICSIHVSIKGTCLDGAEYSNTNVSYEIEDGFYDNVPISEYNLFSSPKEAAAKMLEDYYRDHENERPIKKK